MKKIIKQTISGLLLSAGLILLTQCKYSNPASKEFIQLKTSKEEVSIRVGSTDTIKIMSGMGKYKALSMNTDIVSVKMKEKDMEMSGLREGNTSITVFDLISEQTKKIRVEVLSRIPDLSLSTYNVKLIEGDEYFVNIIQGSGKYDITIEQAQEAVIRTEIIDNKKIKITGLKAGDSSFTITDLTTGQTKEVRIRVGIRIPDIKVAEDTLNMFEQEKRTVKITQGSGSYSASSDNGSILKVRVTGGNLLEITAIKEGTTKVFIVDNITKKSTEIGIKITPFRGVEPFVANGMQFSYKDPNTVEIMQPAQGQKYSGIIRIPSEVVNTAKSGTPLTVTGIATKAFYNNTEVTEIVLPNTISSIGAEAFSGCENLERINLPEGLLTIGKKSFNSTKLHTLDIPGTVENIDLPFCIDSQLESINVAASNKVYYSEDGILFGREIDEYAEEPNTVVKTLVAMPPMKKITSYTIPQGIVFVQPGAFYGQEYLTSISTSEDCRKLRKGAFLNCEKLESITLGSNISLLDEYCFFECKNIKSIRCFGYPAQLRNNAFTRETYLNAEVTVPAIYEEQYLYTGRWGTFTHYKSQ